MFVRAVTAGLTFGWLCAVPMSLAAAAQSPEVTSETTEASSAAGQVSVVPLSLDTGSALRRVAISRDEVQAWEGMEGIAAAPPGTTVYKNEIDPIDWFWNPGATRRMADDLVLAGGACSKLVYYSLAVYGDGNPSLTYNVRTELWTGDPCKAGSSVIAGTARDHTNIHHGELALLEVSLTSAVSVPATVWLSATFSTSNSGWIIAERAEVGSTGDFYSQVDPVACSPATCCQLWFSGDPYAGFWATVNCDVVQEPTGACCAGVSCSETTEAQCAAGNWKGAYTKCDPSPCLTGTCCTGGDLAICADTTEATCVERSGFFHPQATCAQDPCDPAFLTYRNDQEIHGVFTLTDGTLAADDLTMGPGAPCQLAGFELDVFALSGSGPFSVTAELWTHDTDTEGPGTLIPGTTKVFNNLQDGAVQRLVAGPFTGIVLPQKAWMVLSTTTEDSGWVIGAQALIGSTADVFAIYNDPGYPPNTWVAFDFQDPLVWSGFRSNVWCYGTTPIGACCNSAAGTCIDGTAQLECEGRWALDSTCGANPFDPPCGTNACCALFGCGDMLSGDCLGMGADPGYGSFCSEITCPRPECLSATGDCLTAHSTQGCVDAFCCASVCSVDPTCCTNPWDAQCAETARSLCPTPPPANDHCANARAISGAGQFDFDNTSATMDGPLHEACLDAGGEKRITRDVWYCWTSPCTDDIYIRTCDLTTVDTKLAVYDDCTTCPPTDLSLLDCNDDFCGFAGGDNEQSQVNFPAVQGKSYLIRVGTFPGAEGGTGKFAISCGPPVEPACPGTGDCCEANTTPGCSNELCCEVVCLCDPFCCEVKWDESCARMGVDNNGCGAMLLCPNVCGAGTCPDNPVTFVDPPNGVVDARQPYPPGNASNHQGIGTIKVQGVPGIDNITCWSLCETAQEGLHNDVASVIANGDGTFNVNLERPITTGAVTTVTYRGKSGGTYKAKFTSHPANVDGDSASGPVDILRTIDCLNCRGSQNPPPPCPPCPWGIYSCDLDQSGVCGAADILRIIDLLNGADEFDPWLGEALPACGACCP